jgi:hypothetical protein
MDYFIGVDGVQEGPLPESEIGQRIASGRLHGHHLCWRDGWAEWKPVREVFPEAFAAQVPPPVPVAVAPAYAPAAGAGPVATSGMAIASLVLGVLGILLSVLTAIPAVVCGHVALSKIRRSAGRLTGGGFAIAGLVLGYVWIGFGLLILPAVMIPAFVNARDSAQSAASRNNLQQIATAGTMYSLDHKGMLPNTPEELIGADLLTPGVMDLPYTNEKETDGYVFVPGRTTAMPSETIFAYESVPRRDGSVGVARIDGSVAVLPADSPELEQLRSGKY